MVVLPIVNMLLTLLGFSTPWRRKSRTVDAEATNDLTEGQTKIPQFNQVVQKG